MGIAEEDHIDFVITALRPIAKQLGF